MLVQLLDVDEFNWRDCAKLKVSEKDKAYIDPNIYPIAEWKFEPENIVKAIYSNTDLVGMLAYYYHDGVYGEFYWLYHLMIEPQNQGSGFGQAALNLAIEEMRALGAQDIVTDCVPENNRAHYIYRKRGFTEHSNLDGGGLLLRLPEGV